MIRALVDAGIHFGHRSSRWNPKMAPYIFGKRSLIHIIDVRETIKGILRAKHFVSRVVSQGKDILLVGTKRQARTSVQRVAAETGMHYVNDRWLGGTLTNFRTIRSRLARLEELENLFASGAADRMSKKATSALRRELRKIKRNLDGIRSMERLPGLLVLIDQKREINAIREANKLGIPTICLLDTDSDPDLVDLPIPGNDDAMRAIDIILGQIGEAIQQGKAARVERDLSGEDAPRRRSRRVLAAAGDAEQPAQPAEAPAQDQAQ